VNTSPPPCGVIVTSGPDFLAAQGPLRKSRTMPSSEKARNMQGLATIPELSHDSPAAAVHRIDVIPPLVYPERETYPMSISSQGRLTQPLIRENGAHRPASWDEAFHRVAQAFRNVTERRDPRLFGMFSCSKTTNELNYVAQKFVRSAIGSNNIDSCNRT